MKFVVMGCNFHSASVEVRERLALTQEQQQQVLDRLKTDENHEAVILSTCNRFEVYLAGPGYDEHWPHAAAVELLASLTGVDASLIASSLYLHTNISAIEHLGRVAASLDSLVLGEGQIAGQVKAAYEMAQQRQCAGSIFHQLFPQVLRMAKRVRTETGISHGHVSVSSVAVDFVRQVFENFSDKAILLIGAGKMARLTLKHLQELRPGRITVTNRSPERAREVAQQCGGHVCAWDQLDQALIEADIVLSTTGAPELIITQDRFFSRVYPKRTHTLVVLDIAVPRDFDPSIHDGERVFLFNIDDLTKIREQTLAQRRRHITQAEMIIQEEVKRCLEDWQRRQTGPVIQELRSELDQLRHEVVQPLMTKLNGKLTDAEKEYIEGAFRLFQNKLMHRPIDALQHASRQGNSLGLLEAVRRLFRLSDR